MQVRVHRETTPAKWSERDSNPWPPDLESGALTTRPRCLPKSKNINFRLMSAAQKRLCLSSLLQWFTNHITLASHNHRRPSCHFAFSIIVVVHLQDGIVNWFYCFILTFTSTFDTSWKYFHISIVLTKEKLNKQHTSVFAHEFAYIHLHLHQDLWVNNFLAHGGLTVFSSWWIRFRNILAKISAK